LVQFWYRESGYIAVALRRSGGGRATLQERNGSYRVLFRHGGRRHTFTIGKVEPREADLIAADVDRGLLRIEQRLLKVPPDVDLVAFVRAGGQTLRPRRPPRPNRSACGSSATATSPPTRAAGWRETASARSAST